MIFRTQCDISATSEISTYAHYQHIWSLARMYSLFVLALFFLRTNREQIMNVTKMSQVLQICHCGEPTTNVIKMSLLQKYHCDKIITHLYKKVFTTLRKSVYHFSKMCLPLSENVFTTFALISKHFSDIETVFHE